MATASRHPQKSNWCIHQRSRGPLADEALGCKMGDCYRNQPAQNSRKHRDERRSASRAARTFGSAAFAPHAIVIDHAGKWAKITANV